MGTLYLLNLRGWQKYVLLEQIQLQVQAGNMTALRLSAPLSLERSFLTQF